MTKGTHEQGDRGVIGYALMIAPRFAQRMRTKITNRLDLAAPFLDEVTDRRDRQ